MEHKDESYLDSLLDNVSNDSDNLYNTMLDNDANSFQMDEKEIDDINFDDIDDDISFDLDSDFGLGAWNKESDFDDSNSKTFEKMKEEKVEPIENEEKNKTTKDIELENQKESETNEEMSSFEDNLMESLLAEDSSSSDSKVGDIDEENQEVVNLEKEDAMADVDDLLNLLQSEEGSEELDNQEDILEGENFEKNSEDVFSINSLEEEELEENNLQPEPDLLNDSMEDSIKEFLNPKENKISFWKRLFGNIHDEKAKKKNKVHGPLDDDGNPIKKPKKTKQEIKAEKEAKKKAKEEVKKDKTAKAAERKAKREEKKKNKEENNEKNQQVIVEEEGRINPVGATIVFMVFGLLATCIVLGTDSFSYAKSIKNATQYFGVQKYNSAYEEVNGISIKQKDSEIYDKVMTVMFVNKELNSYNNYYTMKMYPEALDSLLKGLKRYDEYVDTAKELGVKSDFDYVRNQIIEELNSMFELTEKDSYNIIHSNTQELYSQKVIKAASVK